MTLPHTISRSSSSTKEGGKDANEAAGASQALAEHLPAPDRDHEIETGQLAIGASGEASQGQMTPAQCRAARALIDMSQAELARAAVMPVSIIADFEAGVSEPRHVDAIR